MKKNTVTQELVNIYPSWSKVRNDEQSVGYQLLNTIAAPMEKMDKALIRLRDNQYLTTANIDEIDLTFKIKLDTDFEWDEDNIDPLSVCPLPPSISGLIDGVWYPVRQAESNDIESFWYTSIPNRVSIGNTTSGQDFELISFNSETTSVTGIWEHHLGGGRVWAETVGGVQYLLFEEGNIYRGKILIKGRTRKGTWEEEYLIFPWDMKQPTIKEWKTITEVHIFDMEDDITIDIRSADFNGGPYISPWNLRYSSTRKKIDEFWDLGHNGSIPTLDRIEYQSDDWQQLVLGFSTKETKESWELLESSTNVLSGIDMTVSGIDMTIQPYSDRVWVVTSDNKLYLYDLNDTMPSTLDNLKDSTAGAQIQIDYDSSHVVLGEDIQFTPWHARPLKEILKYRLWFERPDGQQFGILDGSEVDISSDFWKIIPEGTKMKRDIENLISIPTTQRGDYLVVFEAEFIDGETQQVRRIFSTKYKTPLVVLDLSSLILTPIDGIDFDSDQKLWVKSETSYYQINLHTDIMLIDFNGKTIYFKEEYEEVAIETND